MQSVYPPPFRRGRSCTGVKSDWGSAKASAFSEVCVGHLGQRKPMWVFTPAPAAIPRRNFSNHLIFSTGVKRRCELIPGKTAPISSWLNAIYPATYERFTSLGPLLDRSRATAVRGIARNTQDSVSSGKAQLHQTRWPGERTSADRHRAGCLR